MEEEAVQWRSGKRGTFKMYSDGLRKFLVLQWKSLLQKKRHWILTLLEIVIPSILFIAVVVLRYQADEFSPKQIEAEGRKDCGGELWKGGFKSREGEGKKEGKRTPTE